MKFNILWQVISLRKCSTFPGQVQSCGWHTGPMSFCLKIALSWNLFSWKVARYSKCSREKKVTLPVYRNKQWECRKQKRKSFYCLQKNELIPSSAVGLGCISRFRLAFPLGDCKVGKSTECLKPHFQSFSLDVKHANKLFLWCLKLCTEFIALGHQH